MFTTVRKYFSFVILFFSLCLTLVSCKFKPEVSIVQLGNESLIAYNKNAVYAQAENAPSDPYMVFGFTESQKEYLQTKAASGYALKIHFSLLDDSVLNDNSFIKYSFLYEDDFESEAFVKLCNNGKTAYFLTNYVSGNLNYIKNGNAEIVLCFKDKAPSGFLIQSNVNYNLDSVAYSKCIMGASVQKNGSFYAFGPKGGKLPADCREFDFTDAANLFSKKNTADTFMPSLVIGFKQANDVGPYEKQLRTNFSYGKETISIRRVKGLQEKIIYVSAFDTPYANLVFTQNADHVNKVLLMGSDFYNIDSEKKSAVPKSDYPVVPLKTDLGLIINWPLKNWRYSEYELFQWDEFPSVLFFDFADYKIQDQFFTRLAYFVEKAGYKGTFISDEDILRLHGYNAHDYKAYDLAKFYNEAKKQKIHLNAREEILYEILLNNGIIYENDDGTITEGKGSIISISRESPEYLRSQLMAHESWHGIYFEDEDFRNQVLKEYNSFDKGSMEFLLKYFSTQPTLSYDLNDDYLIKNEFMAYLMQTYVANIKNYFLTRANWNTVNAWEPQEAAYVRRTDAQYFYDSCERLTLYVYDRWGITSGRVNLVSRIK